MSAIITFKTIFAIGLIVILFLVKRGKKTADANGVKGKGVNECSAATQAREKWI